MKTTIQNQLLFVYGTLMRNGRAEEYLSGSEFIGKAILKDYAMYKINHGDFPGIVSKKGEWVEGELYLIRDTDFVGLDRYEGEGTLYHREIVTVESSNGRQRAWAYIFLRDPEGSVMRRPWISDKDDVVWYASYGSNLSKERFLCYIKGGVCAANGKEYKPCTNNKLVSEKDDRAWFPGQMYFGNESGSWGHKGVAYYDPDASGKTFMRMFQVTREQLWEIQGKEGRKPEWYGRILALGIHADGRPIYTMTSEYRHPFNAPDGSYFNLISRALVEENGFSEKEAEDYLSGCLAEKKESANMNDADKNVNVLKQAAEFILADKTEEAGAIIRKDYPFVPINKDSRNYSKTKQIKQFFKDGFIDRYFGTKLINPGMLRLLSGKLPEDLPYQEHWDTEKCHMAYWDYSPTMDHIDPISRGGRDKESNWITTSMMGNSAKSIFTIEQLNLHLYPEGDIREWDGLSKLFIEIVETYPELKQLSGVKDWYGPTKRIMVESYRDLLPDNRKADSKGIPSGKAVNTNKRYDGADKQAFLDDIQNHSDSLSEAAISAMADILSVFDEISERYNVQLVYTRSEKANRVIATIRGRDNKWVMAEYSDGEVWGTNQPNTGNDPSRAYIRRILDRLIDEKLFNKTGSNLSTSQWAVKLTGSKKDVSKDKQILRFIEILHEEIS